MINLHFRAFTFNKAFFCIGSCIFPNNFLVYTKIGLIFACNSTVGPCNSTGVLYFKWGPGTSTIAALGCAATTGVTDRLLVFYKSILQETVFVICLTATAFEGEEEGLQFQVLKELGCLVYYNSKNNEDKLPEIHATYKIGSLEKYRTLIL